MNEERKKETKRWNKGIKTWGGRGEYQGAGEEGEMQSNLGHSEPRGCHHDDRVPSRDGEKRRSVIGCRNRNIL